MNSAHLKSNKVRCEECMKIFSGGKSKLKENSAYRNSKDEENEIHETTNKDIDELRFTIERLLNLK